MKVIHTESHRAHLPPFEVLDGGKRVPYLENPDRIDRILSSLHEADWAEIVEPLDFGISPVLAVHDKEYTAFLASCWNEWLASDPEVSASPNDHAFLPATFALRRNPRLPGSLLGKAGYYIMDLSACIVESTYKAALGSVNCALTAAQFISEKSANAFALCRPPGHHAGRDYAGGYCFINNAAVAANWLSSLGKVAVLDIDYHAGNGTQDIFYERSDVQTISIHGDPDYEYPHFIGYADETGAGPGLGFHRNFPLASGTGDAEYISALEEALNLVRGFSTDYLVLSVGMDIFDGDPLGKFRITRSGFREIGGRIAALNLPTALIMEGGYANDELGRNVVSLLENFK